MAGCGCGRRAGHAHSHTWRWQHCKLLPPAPSVRETRTQIVPGSLIRIWSVFLIFTGEQKWYVSCVNSQYLTPEKEASPSSFSPSASAAHFPLRNRMRSRTCSPILPCCVLAAPLSLYPQEQSLQGPEGTEDGAGCEQSHGGWMWCVLPP